MIQVLVLQVALSSLKWSLQVKIILFFQGNEY